MEPSDDEISGCILRVLFPEASKLGDVRDVPEEELSSKTGIGVSKVHDNIIGLVERGLVESHEGGFRLTEKAFWAITQHNRTFCPYL